MELTKLFEIQAAFESAIIENTTIEEDVVGVVVDLQQVFDVSAEGVVGDGHAEVVAPVHLNDCPERGGITTAGEGGGLDIDNCTIVYPDGLVEARESASGNGAIGALVEPDTLTAAAGECGVGCGQPGYRLRRGAVCDQGRDVDRGGQGLCRDRGPAVSDGRRRDRVESFNRCGSGRHQPLHGGGRQCRRQGGSGKKGTHRHRQAPG